MDWTARLAKRREVFSEWPHDPVPEVTKGGYGTFGTAPDGHSENIAPDSDGLCVETPEAERPQASPAATDSTTMRAELLEAARPEGINRDIIHALPDIELQATVEQLAQCPADTRDGVVRAYIRALRDTAEQDAGRVPPGPHAMALCRHCGAVWIASDVVAVLPVVEGVARCLGCPWCHVRIAGGYIPRPKVTCAGCKHFTPDTVNPAGGLGTCASGHKARFPNEQHRCSEWRPKNEHGK